MTHWLDVLPHPSLSEYQPFPPSACRPVFCRGRMKAIRIWTRTFLRFWDHTEDEWQIMDVKVDLAATSKIFVIPGPTRIQLPVLYICSVELGVGVGSHRATYKFVPTRKTRISCQFHVWWITYLVPIGTEASHAWTIPSLWSSRNLKASAKTEERCWRNIGVTGTVPFRRRPARPLGRTRRTRGSRRYSVY